MEAVCRNADSVLRNYFLGIWISQNRDYFFKKDFLNLVSAPQEGSGEECGADSFWIFGGRALRKKYYIDILAKPKYEVGLCLTTLPFAHKFAPL
jgi:hypothetical protein